MTFSFIVRTQHGGGAFICAVREEAETPIAAARARFARQAPSSRAETTAVLVTPDSRESGSAYVFPVREVITSAFRVDEHPMTVLQEVAERG